VLSRVLARLSADYLAAYGHRVLAVETFTDPSRHTGACYAAANFTQVGSTFGYFRSAGAYHHHGNPKRVWMYPPAPRRARCVVRDVSAPAADRSMVDYWRFLIRAGLSIRRRPAASTS
jgi:hypothetical protein